MIGLAQLYIEYAALEGFCHSTYYGFKAIAVIK